MTRFLDLTGASAEMVDEIKRSADWPDMCAIAHTLPYDVAVCDHGCQSLDWLAPLPSPRWSCTAVTVVNGHLPRRRESLQKSRGQRLWRSPVRATASPTTLLSRLCVNSFPAEHWAAKTIVNLGLRFRLRQPMVDA